MTVNQPKDCGRQHPQPYCACLECQKALGVVLRFLEEVREHREKGVRGYTSKNQIPFAVEAFCEQLGLIQWSGRGRNRALRLTSDGVVFLQKHAAAPRVQ